MALGLNSLMVPAELVCEVVVVVCICAKAKGLARAVTPKTAARTMGRNVFFIALMGVVV